MKKHIWMIVFLAFVIIVTGCGKEKDIGLKGAKPSVKGPILAKIGNDVITLNDFEKKIDRLPENLKGVARNNKAAYLDSIINETLLYKEGLKKKLDRDQEVQEIIEEARKRVIIARLARDEVEKKIKIGEEELLNYYEERKKDFTRPEMFRASHILVDTLEEAVSVVDRLNTGTLFEELAKNYSKDVTSNRGGDIGYFTTGEMVPEFEDVCVKLKVGEISGPTKSQFGYHIIKLTDRKEPELVEFGKVKENIMMLIKAQKSQDLLYGLISKLRSKTDITINSELIEPQVKTEEKAEQPASSEGKIVPYE